MPYFCRILFISAQCFFQFMLARVHGRCLRAFSRVSGLMNGFLLLVHVLQVSLFSVQGYSIANFLISLQQRAKLIKNWLFKRKDKQFGDSPFLSAAGQVINIQRLNCKVQLVSNIPGATHWSHKKCRHQTYYVTFGRISDWPKSWTKICCWMGKCNRLALSISILFHSSKLKPNQSLRTKIDDALIKQVDSTKYLRITFDWNLTWKSHINELCLKLSKTVGILSKLRHFVNKHILVMLYYSLIYPFLTYGVHVWGQFNLSLISNTVIYYPKKKQSE